MAGLIHDLATALLGLTTSETGDTWLPRPLARRLALAASGAEQDSDVESSESSALIREAVTHFRASGHAGARRPASRWLLSRDGAKAVIVLPRITQDSQLAILKDRGNILQIITMNHPGLATITETGYFHGFPYAVASFGQGVQNLVQYAVPPMEPREVWRIATQVAEALEYAHHRGVIHGSLTPDQIFIGANHSCNVLGVGWDQLQRDLGFVPRPVAASPLTPPEAAQGGRPDERSDVYAVGALLFWLITGKQPVAGRPVRISQENRSVPEAIDKVLTRALAVSPAERYASMGELTWELRLASRSRPTSPRERSAPRPGAQGNLSGSNFPEALPMPVIDVKILNKRLEVPQPEITEMPTAPMMPQVDWAASMAPVDVSRFASATVVKPHVHPLKDIPDPLQAAAEAALTTAGELEAASAAGQPSLPPARILPT